MVNCTKVMLVMDVNREFNEGLVFPEPFQAQSTKYLNFFFIKQ